MEAQSEKVSPVRLSSIELPPDPIRFSTGISGLDQCLAEDDESEPGLPAGATVLISGSPGGGKSTLSLYMADASANALIMHGEERERMVKKRWDRLKLKSDPLLVKLKESELALSHMAEAAASVVVADSVQCLTFEGGRRHDDQMVAVEMLCAAAHNSDTSLILVNHTTKDGKSHAGAQGLAHIVDVHIHVTVNAHKGTRALEVRKNRHGRAGFEVPLTILGSSITVGTPSAIGSMVAARNQMEKAAAVAEKLLIEGKTLTGYDFIEAECSGNVWRAGLELAARRLIRAGESVEEVKVGSRKGYRMKPKELTPLPTGPETGEHPLPPDVT